MKGVTKTIKNETKKQKGGFLSMLLGTLAASLLGNLLSGKRTVRAGEEGIVRAGYGSSFKKSSNSTTSFKKFLNKSIMKMSLDLMESILEIICLKQ